ncbi:MAG TPA: hypothetical protein VNQ76_17680 [Planctomicrobium sp.]|nr:hypothetical protein [Planctomicrobium sp.]
MRTIIARSRPFTLVALAIWLSLPCLTTTIVVLLQREGLHVIGVAIAASCFFLGGFFVSHWRSSVALWLDDDSLVFIEPGDPQFVGAIYILKIPRQLILSMKLKPRIDQHGTMCLALIVSCLPDVEAMHLPKGSDSQCSVVRRAATSVDLLFTSAAWQWLDEKEATLALCSWLDRGAEAGGAQ